MFVHLDRRFEVLRPKSGRSGEDDDVHVTLEHFFVRIQTDKPSLLGHVEFVGLAHLVLDALQGVFHLALKDVTHRVQNHIAVPL